MTKNDEIILECLEKEMRLIKRQMDDIEKDLIVLRRHADKLKDNMRKE